MIKNYLIIMPFNMPWDWSADVQRQTCFVLHKENIVIAYMKNNAHFFLRVRKYKYAKVKNVYFYTPKYPLPFKSIKTIEKINDYICILLLKIKYGFRKKTILWITNTIFEHYTFFFKRIILLYDCTDYVWNPDNKVSKKFQKLEYLLIRKCDFFIVNSNILAKIHKKTRVPDAIVPQGFRINNYRNILVSKIVFPKDKPIIGFIGAINLRLDYLLLNSLIQNNSQWNFVLWGQIQDVNEISTYYTRCLISKISQYPNLIMGYSKDRNEIGSIIRQFDIGIIPYDINQKFNEYCFPMKLFEYFYIGKPVISTPIEELKKFPKFVTIADNTEEWTKSVNKLLMKEWSYKLIAEQRKIADSNSWKNKINTISHFISR